MEGLSGLSCGPPGCSRKASAPSYEGHLWFYRVALPDFYYAPGVMRCGVAICFPFSSWILMTMRSMVSAYSVISSR